jgi:FAD/FMN-containing dehydrogenase
MAAADFFEQLAHEIGSDRVLIKDQIPVRRHTDWSGVAPVAPLALVCPHTTEEVSTLLRLCSLHQVPVVPQGGLTGLAGAAVPCANGIALSFERMAAIESLEPHAATVCVQAGATVQSVQEAAIQVGLQFGVDFGARGSAQIGGAISTNAGGNGVLQYGMMRDQVLGLEVVLADGTVLPMLRPMLKNNTGYDLKQWFMGAEGTLGVITRALLRLRPLPVASTSALIAVPDFDASLSLLGRLSAAFPGAISAFELMWQDFFSTSLAWQNLRDPFSKTHPMAVLLTVDGQSADALQSTLEPALADAMTEGEIIDAVIAQSQQQARDLWKIREATAELSLHMHPPINFDVSLPLANIGQFAQDCRAALSQRWPEHQTIFFGHVADGNLHISTDGATVAQALHEVESVVYGLVESYGGSVSAEHGIGLHKKPYLSASRTKAEMDIMRAIKRALDPSGILNPGKVFD